MPRQPCTHNIASAGQFQTYEIVSQSLSRNGSAAQGLVGGCCAGAVATCATYPVDLLRTRMAGQGVPKVCSSPDVRMCSA